MIVRRRFSRLRRGDLPDRGAIIGVKGVNAAVFGSNDQQIVAGASWNVDIACIKRFGIDLAVNGNREKFAERMHVHIGKRQNRLMQILPGPCVVVVEGEHIFVGACRWRRCLLAVVLQHGATAVTTGNCNPDHH